MANSIGWGKVNTSIGWGETASGWGECYNQTWTGETELEA